METYRVLVSDSLAAEGIENLRRHPELQVDVKVGLKPAELAKIIAPYHALIVRSATKVNREVLEAASSLKVVGRAGVGIDNVDLEAATRRGIVVMNSPLGNSVTTAEHAISMMLAMARHIPEANATIKAGKWERNKYVGTEVNNKVLGVIGLGNIGRIVADRAAGLKMKVLGYDPIITAEAAAKLNLELVPLEELFARADFITVHTPLNDETRGLINEAAIARMKKGVRLINCARGGIIDEAALAAGIQSGKVAGAALDVFEEEPPAASHPLIGLPQVVATPHLGASTGEAQLQVALDIAEQIIDFLLNGAIRQAVNIPALSAKEFEVLAPHLKLGEQLGRLAAQLIKEAPHELTLQLGGEAANLNGEPITAAVLKGLLCNFLDEPLNFVNAPFIARERGIKVIETRSHDATDYINTLTITVRTPSGEHEVGGAVVGNRAIRLTKIDGFHVEAVPEGYFLMLHNHDVPGVVGAVGSLLGRAGINIAGLDLGRDRIGGMALSLVQIDNPAPPAVLDELKTLPAIVSASLIKL